jgi:hypothetical protein
MAQTLDLPVRLSLAGPVRANAEVEVRLLLGHVMETGFRHDSSGVQVAKDILQFVKVHVGDTLVFESELGTGMAAIQFFPGVDEPVVPDIRPGDFAEKSSSGACANEPHCQRTQ